MTMKIHGDKIEFPDGTEQITAYDGSSGGGLTPTPEALVWEDMRGDRTIDKIYTNTNDVPLYVQLSSYSDGATNTGTNRIDFQIDGVYQGSSGSNGDKTYDNALYLVPSGSTYVAVSKGVVRIDGWQEAKMPVAVGTGGKTVKVLANLPADISSPLDEWIKLPLESDDEGFDNSTHRYKPTVAGWYAFQGQVTGLGINTGISCKIVRNFDSGTYDPDKDEFVGLSTSSDSTHPARSVNALFYLNGKDDYVELQGYNKQTAGYQGNSRNLTSLQGFLISGGSASGGGSKIEPVSFQGYCSTDAQVFTGDTTAQVAFDVFEWDTNSGFDSATSSYTPNVAGYYQVNASVATEEEGVLRATTSIYKNDSMVAYTSNLSQSGTKTNAPINTVVYCNGVDDKLYIKYNPTISGGGTAQIISDSKATYFNVTLMQGTASGDSIWTEEDGKAKYDGDVGITGGLGVGNIDASGYSLYQSVFRVPNGKGVGITRDNAGHNAYLYFGAGTDMAEQQLASIASKGSDLSFSTAGNEAMKIDSSNNVFVSKDLIVASDGYGISWGRSNGSPRIYANKDGELNIRHGEGSVAMTIASDGDVSFTGRVFADEFRSTTELTVPNVANVHMLPDGTMRKSTTTSYSTEEVDKKLAIKDKLIEKLSARLDELEKRIK